MSPTTEAQLEAEVTRLRGALAIVVAALKAQRSFVVSRIQNASKPDDDPQWLYDINVAMAESCKEALAAIEKAVKP